MAAAAVGSASPLSSPRLPSPPPFPEVQIGPKSPGMNATSMNTAPESEITTKLDQGPLRRIRPGTKAADFTGPPLVPLSELDSPFQLQEHLKALHYHHTRSTTDPKLTAPITRETALTIATPPPNIDRSLWLYELCRLLVQKANVVCVMFFREDPPCSAATCPEMRASEWQYLCAVHEPPKSCCAIDYCCHTLEWAADTLTSTKFFPSRLTLGSEANGGSQGGVRQLTNIMRRVYRIFAHAWFQHRGVFWQLENDEGLYVLFKTVCDVYSLIPEENYTIPPEAEGLSAKTETQDEGKLAQAKEAVDKGLADETEEKLTISTGATTRRHKQTPSLGSTVTTIQEGDEENASPESPVKLEYMTPVSAMHQPSFFDTPFEKTPNAAEQSEPLPSSGQVAASVVNAAKAEEDSKPSEEEAGTHGEPKEVPNPEIVVDIPSPLSPVAAPPSIKVEEQEKPED